MHQGEIEKLPGFFEAGFNDNINQNVQDEIEDEVEEVVRAGYYQFKHFEMFSCYVLCA